jgi:anthranilate phosphoribosyltransferase
MIREAIKTAMEGEDLTFEIAGEAMDEIMRGDATAAQIAAFLTALRMKGESIDEITACAAVMRGKCTRLACGQDVMDIVGTGGDEAQTFNISTVTAFVVAAAGVPVAKHGNRCVSSRCGAADCLEALGARIDLTAEESAHVLRQTGMCFMFAPNYHAAMKYAAPVRREIGARTIFNILGPLSNPAFASMMLLGVYDKALVEPLALVLSNLGVRRAMVVHGDDGLDEISLCTTTAVCELGGGKLLRYTLDPRDFGFLLCCRAALAGGDPLENAALARRILGGEESPKRDIVLLNAASCLYLAGKAPDIAAGAALAAALVDSGRARAKMEEFIRVTNEVSYDS